MAMTQCSKCGHQYRVDNRYIGRQVRCKYCDNRMEIVADNFVETDVAAVAPLRECATANLNTDKKVPWCVALGAMSATSQIALYLWAAAVVCVMHIAAHNFFVRDFPRLGEHWLIADTVAALILGLVAAGLVILRWQVAGNKELRLAATIAAIAASTGVLFAVWKLIVIWSDNAHFVGRPGLMMRPDYFPLLIAAMGMIAVLSIAASTLLILACRRMLCGSQAVALCMLILSASFLLLLAVVLLLPRGREILASLIYTALSESHHIIVRFGSFTALLVIAAAFLVASATTALLVSALQKMQRDDPTGRLSIYDGAKWRVFSDGFLIVLAADALARIISLQAMVLMEGQIRSHRKAIAILSSWLMRADLKLHFEYGHLWWFTGPLVAATFAAMFAIDINPNARRAPLMTQTMIRYVAIAYAVFIASFLVPMAIGAYL